MNENRRVAMYNRKLERLRAAGKPESELPPMRKNIQRLHLKEGASPEEIALARLNAQKAADAYARSNQRGPLGSQKRKEFNKKRRDHYSAAMATSDGSEEHLSLNAGSASTSRSHNSPDLASFRDARSTRTQLVSHLRTRLAQSTHTPLRYSRRTRQSLQRSVLASASSKPSRLAMAIVTLL